MPTRSRLRDSAFHSAACVVAACASGARGVSFDLPRGDDAADAGDAAASVDDTDDDAGDGEDAPGDTMYSDRATAPDVVSCEAGVSFEGAVYPALRAACSDCHDEATSAATLREWLLTADTSCGPVVRPGDPAGSSIVPLLSGATCGPRMPFGRDAVAPATVAAVVGWVCEGAP